MTVENSDHMHRMLCKHYLSGSLAQMQMGERFPQAVSSGCGRKVRCPASSPAEVTYVTSYP